MAARPRFTWGTPGLSTGGVDSRDACQDVRMSNDAPVFNGTAAGVADFALPEMPSPGRSEVHLKDEEPIVVTCEGSV